MIVENATELARLVAKNAACWKAIDAAREGAENERASKEVC